MGLAAAWIVITFLPYSFLTYMPHVPSRHTYFASVGLTFILAAGLLTFQERFRMRPAAVRILAAVIVIHHCTYLWTRKHEQYVVRAAPTETLVEQARQSPGPVSVECFPYDFSLASLAVEIRLPDRPVPIVEGRGTRDGLDLCRGFGGRTVTPQLR